MQRSEDLEHGFRVVITKVPMKNVSQIWAEVVTLTIETLPLALRARVRAKGPPHGSAPY